MSPKSTSRVAPDDVEKKLDQTTPGNPQAERNKDLHEKHLTASEKSKKESEVMKLKPHLKGFKERYGAKKGESVMYGVATNRAKEMEESMDLKRDYGFRAMKRQVSTQVKSGLGLVNQSKTIQVTRKNDPSRKVMRISKDKFDATKHVKV